MEIRLQLPKAAQWSDADNYAENLRMADIAGCRGAVPVGRPSTLLADAGIITHVLADGRILTVADDMRTLAVDGRRAGVLESDFRAAMADGDRIIVFTSGGREWVSGGALQGAGPGAPQVGVGADANVTPLSVEVIPAAPLKGVYNRMTTPLQPVDCQAMASQIGAGVSSAIARASMLGLLVQPSWVGWQMTDVDGRIVARGEPVKVGSLQGNGSLRFTSIKNDATFIPTGSDMLSVRAYGLTVRVGRSPSEFWRSRVSSLEIIVWPNCARVVGSTGHFDEINGTSSTLTVAALLEETAREGRGIIAARIDRPLDGVEQSIRTGNLGFCDWDAAAEAARDLNPLAVYCGGSLVAYALDGERGVVGIADSSDPLSLTVRARVCQGSVMRLCAPVGSGGGWNYGRHHLLAFATDGIYALSVDGALKRISSTRICAEGIARADAVAVSSGAVYCVGARGSVLSLRGSKVSEIASPLAHPVAAGWCGRHEELILLGAGGMMAAVDREGRASMRTLFRAERLVEPSMAVDSMGALRNLDNEEAEAEVGVVRRCRERMADRAGVRRRAVWLLDAARVAALKLTLKADGGGSPQRVLELTVDGSVNAPVEADFACPRRAYLTAEVSGRLTAPARLLSVKI